MTDPATLLPALEALAIEAGAAIMVIRDRGAAVREKPDSSPVTDADEAAERIIIQGLKSLLPETPIVAEESMAAGDGPDARETSGKNAEFWLVDPLDGTKEFVRGNGEFTVNIALVRNGLPVAGVVFAPALGRLYAGAVGAGASLMELTPDGASDWHPITVRDAPADALVAIASKSHRLPETDALLARLSLAESRAVGSSLKFCVLAEGGADIYPRFGETMEWDTAAGQAILLAAGGQMLTWDGHPFTYGKPDYRNPGFLACGRLPDELIRSLIP